MVSMGEVELGICQGKLSESQNENAAGPGLRPGSERVGDLQITFLGVWGGAPAGCGAEPRRANLGDF